MSAVKYQGAWRSINAIKVKQGGAWVDHSAIYAKNEGEWREVDLNAQQLDPAYHVWVVYADTPSAQTFAGKGVSLSAEGKSYVGIRPGNRKKVPVLGEDIATVDDLDGFQWSLLGGQDAVVRYISALDGTVIRNGSGTLRLRVREIVGGINTVLPQASVDPQFYVGGVAVGREPSFQGPDIDGKLIVELRNGGEVLDTVSLIDVLDGGEVVQVGFDVTNGLAWTKEANGGSWVPASNTTTMTFTWYQSGSEIAAVPVTVTRASDGTLSGETGLATGDATTVSFNGNDTARLTVVATHNASGVAYAENVVSVQGGEQGSQGPQGPQGGTGPQGNQGEQGPIGPSGQTTYFHIAFADSSDGTVNFNQTAGEYAGTYVDFTEQDSNNPADYTWRPWRGIQGPTGDQGIPGQNGANGQTSYLHIAYANSADGFTDFNQDNGEYIGTYVDFVQQDSNDPSDYTWKKLEGDPGTDGAFFYDFEKARQIDELKVINGTKSVDGNAFSGSTALKLTSTAVDGSTSGCGDRMYVTIPERLALMFAGQKVTVSVICKTVTGEESPEFGVAYSTSDVGNSGWQRFTPTDTYAKYSFDYDVPLPNAGGTDYLILNADMTGAGNSILLDDVQVVIKGDKGDSGDKGDKGDQGNTGQPGETPSVALIDEEATAFYASSTGAIIGSYFPYSNKFTIMKGSVDETSLWSLAVARSGTTNYNIDGEGNLSITSLTSDSAVLTVTATRAGHTTLRKKWTLTKQKQGATGSQGPEGPQGPQGGQGPQGVAGPKGADGVTFYTWIRYADTSTGGGISNNPAGKKYIGLAYNKTTATESNTASNYTWSLIQGPKGNTGVQGPQGPNGQPTYTWIKYSANADGTNLTDSPQSNTKYIGIAPNKLTASESNNKADYTWSAFKGDKGDKGDKGEKGLTADAITGRPGQTWGFLKDAQGWSSRNCDDSFVDGRWVLEGTNNDVGIVSPDYLLIDGEDNYGIRVRIRTTSATHTTSLELYYSTTTRSSFEGAHAIYQNNVEFKQNEWTYLVFDCRELTNGGSEWIDSIIRRIRIDFSNGGNGRTYEVDGVVIGYFGSPEDQDADALVPDPGNLITNPTGKATDKHGRAVGWKPVEGSFEYSSVKYYKGPDGLRVGSAQGDSSVAVGFRALAVSSNTKYRVRLRLRADNAYGSGLYIRMQEYNGNLPEGKTHVGSLGAPHVQPRSSHKSLIQDNSPVPAIYTWFEFDYIPAAGVKFATLSVYNWSGIGSADNVWVNYAEVVAVGPTDDLKNDSLTSENVRRGAGWAALPSSGANKIELFSIGGEGRWTYKANGGATQYIDVFSAGERTKLDRLRAGQMPGNASQLLNRWQDVNGDGRPDDYATVTGAASLVVDPTFERKFVSVDDPNNWHIQDTIGEFDDAGLVFIGDNTRTITQYTWLTTAPGGSYLAIPAKKGDRFKCVVRYSYYNNPTGNIGFNILGKDKSNANSEYLAIMNQGSMQTTGNADTFTTIETTVEIGQAITKYLHFYFYANKNFTQGTLIVDTVEIWKIPSTIDNDKVDENHVLAKMGWIEKPASGANKTTNTNQLTDGANLGKKADWGNVTGTGRPADNANKTDLDSGGAEGQARFRNNDGAWVSIDVFSSAERTKLDRVRQGQLPNDATKYMNQWASVYGSGKPANDANKVELDSDSGVPGRARFKLNGGSYQYLDVFSSSERTQINRLRGGTLPDNSGTILDTGLSKLNSSGKNVVDSRAVNAALASALLRNPSGEGINFLSPEYTDPRIGIPLTKAGSLENDLVRENRNIGNEPAPVGSSVYRMNANADDAWLAFTSSTSNHNMSILPNRKWIVSAWVYRYHGYGAVPTQILTAYIKTPNGYTPNVDTVNNNNTYLTYRGWTRVSWVVDLSGDSATEAFLRIDNEKQTSLYYLVGLMVEPQRAGDNSRTPSPYVPPPTQAPIMSAGNSLPLASLAGATATVSSVSGGSLVLDTSVYAVQAQIHINAHTVQLPDRSVSYNSSNLTVAQNTRYFVYCDDPYRVGGSVTYYAVPESQFSNISAVSGRYWLGSITTASSSNPGGGGAGDYECVSADMYLTDDLLAGDAQEGDVIDAWSYEKGFHKHPVVSCPPALASCVRLVTELGAVVVSTTTPIDLHDGRTIMAINAFGEDLLTINAENETVWRRCVDVEYLGPRKVIKINVGDESYAAGESPDFRIVTHNAIVKR